MPVQSARQRREISVQIKKSFRTNRNQRRNFLRQSARIAASAISAQAIATIAAISSRNSHAQPSNLARNPLPSIQNNRPNNRPNRRIFLVTWRGQTEAERGFVDYWKTRVNPPEIIWRDAAQNAERLSQIAAEIVRETTDLVYAWGTPVSLGLGGTYKKPDAIIGKKIPLVFAIVADAVAAELTTTLNAPGRNITGVSHVAPVDAQMEAMRAYQPIRGVGIIYNALEPNALANVAAWQALGNKHGFQVMTEAFAATRGKLDPSSAEANAAMVARLAKAKINWLYLGPDSHLFTQLPSIANAATERGLATFAAVESMLNTSAPVLVGLVSKFYQVGQFAAYKAEQLLRGEPNPPIETLKRFSLVIRLDTAKQLGTYPPLSLIDYAEFRG
jgi:putative tryptophan/tyrosine transport system substrate-binding protein